MEETTCTVRDCNQPIRYVMANGLIIRASEYKPEEHTASDHIYFECVNGHITVKR